MKKLLAIAAAVGMIGGAASASTVISFETDEAGHVSVGSVSGTQTNGNPQGPFDIGFSSFTVDADTFYISSNPGGPGFNIALNGERDIEITQNVEGLGIDNNNGYYGYDDGDIDGANDNDILVFAFSKAVRLKKVIFENVDGNDDFVFADASASPNAFFADIVNPLAMPDTDGDEGYFDFGGRVVSLFGIGAYEYYDNFRISRIEVAAVPLPATGLLLLGGLAGIGALRRRKKTS